MTLTIAILTAAVLGGSSHARQAPRTPVPADKTICHRGQPTTGSIMAAKRVCHTAEEWKRLDDAAARQSRSGVAPPQVSLDALTPRQ